MPWLKQCESKARTNTIDRRIFLAGLMSADPGAREPIDWRTAATRHMYSSHDNAPVGNAFWVTAKLRNTRSGHVLYSLPNLSIQRTSNVQQRDTSRDPTSRDVNVKR